MALQLDHYRLLGRSGLRVSPIALGAMTFGVEAPWGADSAAAEKIFNLYLERGGNFIDTAHYVQAIPSQRMVAKLARGRRDSLVISSKFSVTTRWGDPNASGNHRKSMMQSVEGALRALETDYIDLLFVQIWDRRTPADEVLRALDDLVGAGKVHYIGLSNSPAWLAGRMQTMAELRGWAPLIALQVNYNLTERAAEREHLPMARELGIGALAWSPLAGGVLAGKYTRNDLDTPASSNAAEMNTRQRINVSTGRLTERNLAIVDVVTSVAQEIGRTPAQVALAWTLQNPAVTCPVVGTRTAEQLIENLGALDVVLSEQHLARLDAASRIELGPPYDLIMSEIIINMFGGVKVTLPPGRES